MSMYKGENQIMNSISVVNEEKVKEIAKEVYSTTEQVVGTWIDGKPLYRKVVDCGTLPNAANKNIPHGITNLKSIIDMRGIAHCDGALPQNLPLPFPYSGAESNASTVPIYMWEENGNVVIKALSDRNSYIAYVILTYTKTTD